MVNSQTSHDHSEHKTRYALGSLTLTGAVSLGTGVMIGAGILALTGQLAGACAGSGSAGTRLCREYFRKSDDCIFIHNYPASSRNATAAKVRYRGYTCIQHTGQAGLIW